MSASQEWDRVQRESTARVALRDEAVAEREELTVELLSIERREDKPGFAARIQTAAWTYSVSRLDGEEGWTVDATTRRRDGFPVHANGYGSRYLMTHAVADASAVRLLDEAAAEVSC